MARLVLNLDDGLMAHLRAVAKGVGIYGTTKETAVFMIRTQVINDMGNENMRRLIEPHLPKKYREAYRKLKQ